MTRLPREAGRDVANAIGQKAMKLAFFVLNNRLLLVLSVLMVFLCAWFVGEAIYTYRMPRTLAVDAVVSTMRVKLEADANPIALQPFDLCVPKDMPDPRDSRVYLGCALGSNNQGTYGRSLRLPSGTDVRFSVTHKRFAIEILSSPDPARAAFPELKAGAVFSVDATRLSELGQTPMTGTVEIGALGNEERGTLFSGRYQLFGTTLTGWAMPSLAYPLGASGKLPSGSKVSFRPAGCDQLSSAVASPRKGCDRAAPAYVQIAAQGGGITDGFRAFAVSAPGHTDLAVEMYQTKPILIHPGFIETLKNDPLLLLLIGMITFIGTAAEAFGLKGGRGSEEPSPKRTGRFSRPRPLRRRRPFPRTK